MTTVFGRDYADIYDAIYRDKDYEGEADLIERILEKRGAPRTCRVLDVGCGTGRHAIALARRGYDVTGIDRSASMLAQARTAASAQFCAGHKTPRFFEADARTLKIGALFEAVLMMFTVLGYQHEEADLSAALDAVREHLAPGGLFIFDVWNGLAVLAQGPARRTAVADDGPARIVRTSSTDVDAKKQLCHVHFEISKTEGGEKTKSWSEHHTLRYFLPSELETVLGKAKLRLLDLRRFPDGEAPPDEQAWNVIGVAQAR